MDTISAEYNSDAKVNLETVKTICRCCLSTDRCMKDITIYSYLFYDLTGIQLVQSDGVPAWICNECSYMLEKCVKFKHKLVKAHALLYEYLARCAPFPIDAQDPELSKYATPLLVTTHTLTIDSTGKSKLGFHPIAKHTSTVPSTELNVDLVYNDVKDETAVEIKKEDPVDSDLDDDVPLEEYRSSFNSDKLENITEEEFKVLLEGSEGRILEKKTGTKRKKKLKKNGRIRKNGTLDADIFYEEPKTTVRRSVIIDPSKIAMIQLNPTQQLEFREELRKDEKYTKSMFKCEECIKGFNHKVKLQNHMKKHSPSRGKFECKMCNMYLPTNYSYKVHSLTHTTRYECLKCGRRMVDKASIVAHYSAAHEGILQQYTCHLCGKVSHNSKTHYGHIRNNHSGSRPKCDQCGKTFCNLDSLSDHMLIHQGVKDHACEVCGQRFRTKTQAKYHLLKHSNSKNFYCVECDVRFKSEHSLRQHLYKSGKHRDKATLKYPCPRCESRFDTTRSLQHHLVYQHDGVRLHSCPHCGTALATKNSLAKHVRSAHEGYKPPLKHVCDACGKAFRSKNILTNHVRTHTGEKPFECAECGRKFSQRTAMRTHVKLVHLKVKRNAKLKDIQELVDGQKLVTKQELGVEFDAWTRPLQSDLFFTVTAGQ